MNKIAFFYAIIILCIIQLACFVFIANLHSWLGEYITGDVSQLYSPNSVELFESAFLALLLVGATGFVTFVRDLLFVQKKTSNTNGTFHKFYLPIIEELLKFGLVYFVARRGRGTDHLAGSNETIHGDTNNSEGAPDLGVKQVAIIALVFNFVKFCQFTYRFSPINYEKGYKEFISLYRMWREHITIDRALRSNNKVKVDAAMILAGSLNDGERSVYSKKSTATLIAPEVMSIPSRVPSLDTGSLNFKKLPSFKSDMVSADLESCYNLVDKLYSISPKNTYHLDTDDVIVVSIDDLEDDEDPLKSIANYSNNTLNSNVQHYEQNNFQKEGGKEKNNLTQISDLNLERNACCIASSNDNGNYDTSPFWTSQFISNMNFFAWLLPFLPIPQKSEELNNNTRPLTNNRKFDSAIKNKLSSYQLDRNSVTDTETLHSSEALLSQHNLPISNYGAIDLESQISADAIVSSICVNERNNIIDFQLFVDNYFGYTYDSNQISIDPIFEMFGVTITEFSAKLFIILFNCNYVWNLSTFLIYAYPFFNDSFSHFHFMILGILIIKLFNRNFIHSKDLRKSIKFSLVVEISINLIIFVGIILLLLFGVDYT